MTATRTNLLGLDLEGLVQWCAQLGEKRFRATQLYRWIHQKGVSDFSLMSDLAKSLREKLAAHAVVQALPVIQQHISADGTIKWLFDVGDGNAVEAVFIPEYSDAGDQPSPSSQGAAGEKPASPLDRGTLCISSQAGCAVNCRFCSTGHQGFNRNLTTSEIVAQLWFAEHFLRRHLQTEERVISNVVMMGMGEPLANFDAVVKAMAIMQDDFAYMIAKTRLTLSTSGIVPNIYRLREVSDVSLAVSLHAPNDALRDELVPINRKYPLAELLPACKAYVGTDKRRRITWEYVMLDGINDSLAHAKQMIRLLEGIPSKVNLIPFNPFPGNQYGTSPPERIEAFRARLAGAGIFTMTRKTRGDEIAAACGQLVGRVEDRSRRLGRVAVAIPLNDGVRAGKAVTP